MQRLIRNRLLWGGGILQSRLKKLNDKRKFSVLKASSNSLNALPNYVSLDLFVQLLLRKKAAEELKKEQERKAMERRKVIDERCGTAKDLESASEGNYPILPGK